MYSLAISLVSCPREFGSAPGRGWKEQNRTEKVMKRAACDVEFKIKGRSILEGMSGYLNPGYTCVEYCGQKAGEGRRACITYSLYNLLKLIDCLDS